MLGRVESRHRVGDKAIAELTGGRVIELPRQSIGGSTPSPRDP